MKLLVTGENTLKPFKIYSNVIILRSVCPLDMYIGTVLYLKEIVNISIASKQFIFLRCTNLFQRKAFLRSKFVDRRVCEVVEIQLKDVVVLS